MTAVFPASSTMVTSAEPERRPGSVYWPAGRWPRSGNGSPGWYGIPQGTVSETGETLSGDSGLRLVSLAIISLVRRPPGSVDVGHGSGFSPPQDGAVTSACQ